VNYISLPGPDTKLVVPPAHFLHPYSPSIYCRKNSMNCLVDLSIMFGQQAVTLWSFLLELGCC